MSSEKLEDVVEETMAVRYGFKPKVMFQKQDELHRELGKLFAREPTVLEEESTGGVDVYYIETDSVKYSKRVQEVLEGNAEILERAELATYALVQTGAWELERPEPGK